MRTISFTRWIVDAAARFSGRRGAVSQQARQNNHSRQTVYDHGHKVLQAVTNEHSGGPSRQQLIEQNQTLRQENAQLRNRLNNAIEFPQAKQQEFSARARAMGLSLNQISALLVVILGQKASPARSTIGRWVQAAGKAAGRVLKQLDAQCKALVLLGCLDEIFFHGHPVLVGVEPRSMVWFLGKKVGKLKGSVWAEQLQAWDALQHVVADAGVPLQAGIAQVQMQRSRDNKDPMTSGLDVFHTKDEACKALAIAWNQMERDWEAYDQADSQIRKDQRNGINAQPAALRARWAWTKVVKSFARYEMVETAWKQAAVALNVFRPDGRLNDRAWAEAQVELALPNLVGRAWVRVCNHLKAPEAFTFLDRMHNELAQIPVSDELRDALVRLWWLRRQRPRKSIEGPVAGAGHVAHLVQQEICQKLDATWREWYRQIAAILRETLRASSLVECMNSVLRMHQGRHRTITPEMLDLKRLYWNCRVFQGGKRKGKCPYEHIGLELPTYDFWSLLQPEFTTALTEAKAKTRAKAA
jgi:regulator of replication initiation timing